MSISNVGQRFTAVNLQSGKNVPHPTVGNTSNTTDIKTKPTGTADKTNKRLQALQEGLKQPGMPPPQISADKLATRSRNRNPNSIPHQAQLTLP